MCAEIAGDSSRRSRTGKHGAAVKNKQLTRYQATVAYQLFMRGQSVEQLAALFCVSASEIEAVIRARGSR